MQHQNFCLHSFNLVKNAFLLSVIIINKTNKYLNVFKYLEEILVHEDVHLQVLNWLLMESGDRLLKLLPSN